MKKDLEAPEVRRGQLHHQIEALGDFRPGLISVNCRKCGKKNCACNRKDHPGHGPRYIWNATRKGKSLAQNLRPGPELDKVQEETRTCRRFDRWCQEVAEVNENICRLRPVPGMESENELEGPKKN